MIKPRRTSIGDHVGAWVVTRNIRGDLYLECEEYEAWVYEPLDSAWARCRVEYQRRDWEVIRADFLTWEGGLAWLEDQEP